MDEAEQTLTGGNVNVVVRVGATVRRLTQPWTPTVHALLQHLHLQGFPGAPQALGLDPQGREVLSFIPGDVPQYPVPTYVLTDQTLQEVVQLLRHYHDATRSFTPPPGAVWPSEVPGVAEVICHNDIAPYNTVFRHERPVAWIDFDSAAPGPRLWDVVYAAYRFVPLEGAAREASVWPTHLRRLRRFCELYGLNEAEWADFTDTLLARLDAMCGWLLQGVDQPESAQARLVQDGHLAYYQREQVDIATCRTELQAAVEQ